MTLPLEVLRLAELAGFPPWRRGLGGMVAGRRDWISFIAAATPGELRAATEFLTDHLRAGREPHGN